MSDAKLLSATPDDVEALAAFINRGYRGDTARRGWTHEADILGGQRTDAATLAASIADPDAGTLLILRASGSDAILACVATQLVSASEGSPKCHLSMLTVRPEAQGRGLGRRLIGAVESRARVAGCVAVEMTVIHVRTELIAYYGRRGYRPTGRTEPFPYHDARFGLPKREDLYFVVLEKRFFEPAPASG